MAPELIYTYYIILFTRNQTVTCLSDIIFNCTTQYSDKMVTKLWATHQFFNKFGNAESAKTSGQCLCLLLAKMGDGRTALCIKSSFTWMFHY